MGELRLFVISKFGSRALSSSRLSTGQGWVSPNLRTWTMPPFVHVLAIIFAFFARLVLKYISAWFLSRSSFMKMLFRSFCLSFSREVYNFLLSHGFASSTNIGLGVVDGSFPRRLAWKPLTVTSSLWNKALILSSTLSLFWLSFS